MTAPNAALAYRAFDTAQAAGRLDMREWVDGPLPMVGLAELIDAESCGTTACLAGWAAALAGYQVSSNGVVYKDGVRVSDHIESFAANLLGISKWTASHLFYVEEDELEGAMAEIFGPRPEGGSGGNVADGGEGGSVKESAS